MPLVGAIVLVDTMLFAALVPLLPGYVERFDLSKTGAGGLRTVLEDTLLDVMYEVPSRSDVEKCIVSGDRTANRRRPLLVTSSGQEIAFDTQESIERLKGVSA